MQFVTLLPNRKAIPKLMAIIKNGDARTIFLFDTFIYNAFKCLRAKR